VREEGRNRLCLGGRNKNTSVVIDIFYNCISGTALQISLWKQLK